MNDDPPMSEDSPSMDMDVTQASPPRTAYSTWLTFSHGGQRLAVATADNAITIWDLNCLHTRLAPMNLDWEIVRCAPRISSLVRRHPMRPDWRLCQCCKIGGAVAPRSGVMSDGDPCFREIAIHQGIARLSIASSVGGIIQLDHTEWAHRLAVAHDEVDMLLVYGVSRTERIARELH